MLKRCILLQFFKALTYLLPQKMRNSKIYENRGWPFPAPSSVACRGAVYTPFNSLSSALNIVICPLPPPNSGSSAVGGKGEKMGGGGIELKGGVLDPSLEWNFSRNYVYLFKLLIFSRFSNDPFFLISGAITEYVYEEVVFTYVFKFSWVVFFLNIDGFLQTYSLFKK